MMKGIQKIISGILVFCLLLPMLSMQVVAAEETIASTEEIMDVTHTIAEDAEKTTWTEAEMQDYSGNITWVPYGEDHVHEYDANHKCECGAIGGICGENLIWEFNSATGAFEISGTGDIPAYYDGVVPPWYDYKTNITKVVVREGITEIGMLAFGGCTNLTSMELPESLIWISEAAFSDCSSLFSVEFPENVTVIGSYAFQNCSNLQSIVIPDSVTNIYTSAFDSCSELKSITFEGDAPSIHENAFSSVMAIAHYPANNSTWTEQIKQDYGGTITWVPYGDSVSSGTCGDNLIWTFEETNGTLTISGTGKMTSYSNAHYQPWYNFSEKITSVVVQKGVTSIGESAFRECYGLTNVNLPDTLNSIHNNAFRDCEALASIEIPDKVNRLNNYVFWGCKALKKVKLPAGITVVNDFLFYECSNLNDITIPDGIAEIGQAAFDGCTAMTSVSIPDSVVFIDSSAFSDCTSLENVTLSSNIKKIDVNTFARCSDLKTITIPESVNRIEGQAFYDCINLETIIFEGNASTIAKNAFYNVIANAYYPKGNITWTEEVMQDYGGDITWKPYCPDGHTYDNDQDTTCNDCGHVRELEGAEDDTTPMFRLYNPYTLEHLLTADAAERDLLVSTGWSLDGVAWDSPNAGDHVYRLYNPYDDWHTYSMNQEEIDMLVPLGWKVDGAVCRSATKAEGKPVYRLFNPYEQKNYPLLTASEEERAFLMDLGWTLDGVAWYCLAD